MNEHSFSDFRKTVLRPACFALMALMLGGPLNYHAAAKPQRRALTTDQILSRIRRAHFLSEVPKNAFNSFLLSGCRRIDQGVLPKNSMPDLNCIREETGVLQPSHAYVSVAVGTSRVTELIDIEQAKGWQLIDPATFSGDNPSRKTAALQKMKYDALVENTKHSLPALLALLQSPDQHSVAEVEVISGIDGIVLKWQTEQSLNEFFFGRRTFLCQKQVRTVGRDKSIMKYSDYRRIANVMLPHTIVAAKGDGTILATREIRKWELAVQWPNDHFHPETIRVFQQVSITP
jgi:hypothetical protein